MMSRPPGRSTRVELPDGGVEVGDVREREPAHDQVEVAVGGGDVEQVRFDERHRPRSTHAPAAASPA